MQDLSKVLNFIGVVLNILAGVMLAPEAIGIERIRKLEHKTEISSQSILRKIANVHVLLHWIGYWVGRRLKINPFSPRAIVFSTFIYITIFILLNKTTIFSGIQYIFLCLFNPLHAAQGC